MAEGVSQLSSTVNSDGDLQLEALVAETAGSHDYSSSQH